MNGLHKFFKKKVYAQTKDIIKASFQTRDINNLKNEGVIHKVKPGLYRLSEVIASDDISASFIDVCLAIPNGIICLLSALEFYDLTTFMPSEIYVAIPHDRKPTKMIYPPIRVFYFRKSFYEPGIEIIKTKYGDVRIYNREKTICDIFRYRNKLGEDVAFEGLRNYLASKESDIEKMIEYSKICQVKTLIYPYMKALVG